jgi:serine/threonine protein kinase
MMAVKKIDNAALSLQEEDNFLEAVSNMSHLRHPNIVSLVGYCVEHGQRLLVYEYIANGSVHDILHFADDGSKTLSWNARVRVALGTARALEYVIYIYVCVCVCVCVVLEFSLSLSYSMPYILS